MVRRKRIRRQPLYRPTDSFLDTVFKHEASWPELAAMVPINVDNLRGYLAGRRTIGPRVAVKLIKLATCLGVPAHTALIEVTRG